MELTFIHTIQGEDGRYQSTLMFLKNVILATKDCNVYTVPLIRSVFDIDTEQLTPIWAKNLNSSIL